MHFILQHQSPVTGNWEEKHSRLAIDTLKTDQKPHLYTLVIRPNNSFEVFVDRVSVQKGDLLVDLLPPINPPKEVSVYYTLYTNCTYTCLLLYTY